MIYISYFANMKNIPSNIEVVGICNKLQPWIQNLGIRNITDLAPTDQILRLYRNKSISQKEYILLYLRDVLSQLTVEDILEQLGDKDVCLCCYEKSGEFCHRYIVAKWLQGHGVEVKEIRGDNYKKITRQENQL